MNKEKIMIQENELKQILSADLGPSVIIDAKIEEAYNRIRSTETVSYTHLTLPTTF